MTNTQNHQSARIKQIGLLVLSGMLAMGGAHAASSVDVANFSKKYQQSISQNQQAYTSASQKREAEYAALEEEETTDSTDVSESSPKKVTTTKIPNCQCDDPNDANNYSTNFSYDIKGNKTYRIKPYCRCMPTLNKQAGIATKSINATKDKDQQSPKKFQWNIRY